MEIKVNKSVYDAVGVRGWATVGVDEAARMSWQKSFYIDLAQWSLPRLRALHELLSQHRKSTRAVDLLLRDIETWIGVIERGDKVKCRSAAQFNALVIEELRKVPGQRLYFKDEERGCWFAYYVESVRYVPPKKHRERADGNKYRTWTEPARVHLNLKYIEYDVLHTEKLTLMQEDVVGRDPIEALAEHGWYVETPDLREQYLSELERYNVIAQKVGHQLLGTGDADVVSRDTYSEEDDDGGRIFRRNWWSLFHKIRLDVDGEPARLVVDTDEKDTEKRARQSEKLDVTWWQRVTRARKKDHAEDVPLDADDEEDDEDDDSPEQIELAAMGRSLKDADEHDALPEIEVPVHLMLVCFDLRRHVRVSLHIGSTTDYTYDTALGARLILPNDVRDLVGMLVSQRSAFRDAIGGKGVGAAVLLTGAPGTGKTLTAEVYSEVMKKPLYSVQAAQLGVGERTLERNLLRTFRRAERWNAILLIDEADVYVMRRGNSLDQNAVVATFLRVLEYYSGILFFTTNRADMVDDAIASRCIARIDYKIPHPMDQSRIWRTLADVSETEIDDATIAAIVEVHNDLSGRDIKNLLKLARLVSKTRKQPIDVEMITFVKRFKPTGPVESDREEQEGGWLVIEQAKRAPRSL